MSLFRAAALLLVASSLVSAQAAMVRVTSARANVRAEANEKSPVLTQVTAGTLLQLVATEGDWFRVQVPVSGVRVEAYISRKVSTLVSGAASSTSAARPAPADKLPEIRDGMSVVVQSAAVPSWLTPRPTRVVRLVETRDSVATLAALMPSTEPPLSSSGSTRVTYVWILEGRTAGRVLEDRRPVFAVVFKDIPGVSPDDVAPALVRLAATAWGVRVAAAARGRADQASRAEADWDVAREIRQDVIRVEATEAGRGALRLQPVDNLPPGDYAVVLRPNGRKRLAGTVVLSPEGEGRLFGVAFEFAIK